MDKQLLKVTQKVVVEHEEHSQSQEEEIMKTPAMIMAMLAVASIFGDIVVKPSEDLGPIKFDHASTGLFGWNL